MEGFRSIVSQWCEKARPLLGVKDLVFKAYQKIPALPRPLWLSIYIHEYAVCLQSFKISEEWSLREESILKEHLKRYQRDWLVALVDEGKCFHQELTLALTDEHAIAQVLPFQLEHILPFTPQEAVWTFSSTAISATHSRIFVSCMRRQDLMELYARVKALGLDLDYAISPAFAAQEAHARSPLFNSTCLYGWLRSGNITFFLVDKTGLRGVRDVAIDLQALTPEFFHQEARKTALYLQAPASHERCLWTDEEALSVWQENFDTPNFSQMSWIDRKNSLLQASLDVVSRPSSRSMLFDCSGFGPSSSWKKCRPAALYLQKALAALACALLVLSYVDLAGARHQLRLASEAIETQAREQKIILQDLSEFDDLQAWLSDCEEKLDKSLSSYPLSPNLPQLRDTLAWVCDMTTNFSSAKLLSVDYLTETRPDPGHHQAKYRIKVELEFEIADLEVSQQIQETLLHAYTWIDRPQTMSWKAQKGRYKVSFYLKDRTQYGA